MITFLCVCSLFEFMNCSASNFSLCVFPVTSMNCSAGNFSLFVVALQ